MRPALELRDVEAFVAVVETGSFTQAAQSLFLTQPAVSGRVASLEAALRTRLIDRLPGGARPTPAGEVFLARARVLLKEREDAVRAVDGFLERPTGPLHVGASTIPGTFLLPRAIGGLGPQALDLGIRLHVDDSSRVLEQLALGAYELAVVGAAPDDAGLLEETLAQDEVLLAAAPRLLAAHGASESIEGADLARLPLILRERGSGTRQAWLEALEAADVAVDDLRVALEVNTNSAARQAALAGLGAAVISRWAVEEDLAAGRLVAIPGPGGPILRPIRLVTRAGRTPSPAAAALVAALRAQGKAR